MVEDFDLKQAVSSPTDKPNHRQPNIPSRELELIALKNEGGFIESCDPPPAKPRLS